MDRSARARRGSGFDLGWQTMSKFLDLAGELRVYNHWIGVRPCLNASELKVLFRLLRHQNPESGRCDPSIVRLSADTGVSQRMVRKAIAGLEKRGAIKVVSRSRGHRNRYFIPDVTKGSPGRERNHSSKSAELGFRKDGNRASPEKENEKERKREPSIPRLTGQQASARRDAENGSDKFERASAEMLERKALEMFQAKGLSYEDLIALPGEVWNEVREAFCGDSLSVEEAVSALLEHAAEGVHGAKRV